MGAPAEQVKIEFAQNQTKVVGILGLLQHRARPVDGEDVRRGLPHRTGEKTRIAYGIKTPEPAPIVPRQHVHGFGAGLKGAHEGRVAVAVRAKKGKRVREPALDELGRGLCVVGHGAPSSGGSRRRSASARRPMSGRSSQSGRLAAS